MNPLTNIIFSLTKNDKKLYSGNILLVCCLLLLIWMCGCSVNQPTSLQIDVPAVRSFGEDYCLNTELPKTVASPDSLKYETGIQKIVEFQEGISLYGLYDHNDGADEMSVLITWGDVCQIFDWDYLATGGLSLSAHYFDVDRDEQNELVVTIFVGGGTGASFSELHIVELDTTGKKLTDFKMPYDLTDRINEHIDNEPIKNGIRISMADQTIDLSEDDGVDFITLVSVGNIVEYDILENQIAVFFGMGMQSVGSPIQYVAKLFGKVRFADGVFSVGNFILEQY